MLTLLAMLGGSGANTMYLKMLFDSQLLVLELALIVAIWAIISRGESNKRTLSHVSAILLIVGTILVSIGAAIPL